MSYQVFARKYRPQTFKDVLGQDHVVKTLRNAIEQERLAHAYLFVGPRGTGKTSTARIFAKALNCTNGPSIDFDPNESICQEIAEGRSLDVLEIDGASNNGVDQVRELRETAQFAPSQGRFKIYYIDEVHMLSNAAFNALLKILEEPPAHVKFIFATTEAHKILPTIISRCQRFDLRPIPTETIAEQVQYISKNEGVSISAPAAWAIAKGADGGMRDAQSMLDQLVAFCGTQIEEQDVLNIFGFTSRETVAKLAEGILTQNTATTFSVLANEAEAGKELNQILNELIGTFRSLLVSRIDPDSGSNGIPDELWAPLVTLAHKQKNDRLLSVIEILAEAEEKMRSASNKRIHFEVGMIKTIQTLNQISISDVVTALGGVNPAVITPDTFATPATQIPAQPQAQIPRAVTPTPTIAEEKTETPSIENQTPAPAPTIEPETQTQTKVEPKTKSEPELEPAPQAPSSSLGIEAEEVFAIDSQPSVEAVEEAPPAPEAIQEAVVETPTTQAQPPVEPVKTEAPTFTPEPDAIEDDSFFSTPALAPVDESLFGDDTLEPNATNSGLTQPSQEEPSAPESSTDDINLFSEEPAPEKTRVAEPTLTLSLETVQQAWAKLIEQFTISHPMEVVAMETAQPLAVRENKLIFGVPIQDAYTRNVLVSPVLFNQISEALTNELQQPVALSFELSSEVQAVEIPVEAPPAPEPMAAKAPAQSQPAEASQKTETAEPKKDLNEDFYNDPLIQEALNVFEGKIRN